MSLIAWSARTVAALPWLDGAVLSTDDDEIAEEGRRHGLDVPFRRPGNLATDAASSIDAWQHAWVESERHYRGRFDCSILLQPTTPLRRPRDVERTLEVMLRDNVGSAVTVSPVPAHFASKKCLTIDAAGRVRPADRSGDVVSRRQELASSFWRNGACYAVQRDKLIERGLLVDEDCGAVVIEEFMINIDDYFELELAELWWRRLRERGDDLAQGTP